MKVRLTLPLAHFDVLADQAAATRKAVVQVDRPALAALLSDYVRLYTFAQDLGVTVQLPDAIDMPAVTRTLEPDSRGWA